MRDFFILQRLGEAILVKFTSDLFPQLLKFYLEKLKLSLNSS